MLPGRSAPRTSIDGLGTGDSAVRLARGGGGGGGGGGNHAGRSAFAAHSVGVDSRAPATGVVVGQGESRAT